MNTEELTKFLEDNKPEFDRALKARIIDSMTQQVQWDLPGLISKQVQEFYANELKPLVAKHLEDNKSAIMQVVISASTEAAGSVAVALAEQIKGTMLNDGYKRENALKALFGFR